GAAVLCNSTLPEVEQAAWLGRGVTGIVTGGAQITTRWLSLQLAPTVSWSQNQSFELAPNGQTGDGALRNARFPGNIDAPQRFGASSFTRVNAGISHVAIETRPLSVGFSTAPMAWGPARDEPLVIGPNAGGFAHVYFASGEPWPVGIGHLQLKLVGGRLEQSDWSPMETGDRSRFLSAAVASFQPRGVNGLELGVVRIAARIWRPGTATMGNFLRPLTGILSDPENLQNAAEENGYASVFFRWALRPVGFEVYGEYGREDYAGNVRWLIQKPDDLGSLLLGAQRAIQPSVGRLHVYRFELINAELSSNERGQRGLASPHPPYIHGAVSQGLTVGGQILGSATAYGGAGWRMARDEYTSAGRQSVVIERRLLRDWLPVAAGADGRAPEVRYGARFERLRFRDRNRELGGSVGLSYTLNRNTVPGQDALNLQLAVQWRGW
ncbi:MAG: capsule assembly Wzi family protein, partial [Gemmatimonadaceae bacterium]|nr:capsule assembly Wzi family protein [Gemmatimonadaceae bacterium]